MGEQTQVRAIVICVGNGLVADDGVGEAIYDRLTRESLPDGVELRFVGVAGIAMLDALSGEDLLIVVDAVQLGWAPGTVHVLDWDDLPRPGPHAVSVHGIGVRETIEVGRLVQPDDMPHQVVLIGVEGVCFDQVGAPLTPAVAAAVGPAVERVMARLGAV